MFSSFSLPFFLNIDLLYYTVHYLVLNFYHECLFLLKTMELLGLQRMHQVSLTCFSLMIVSSFHFYFLFFIICNSNLHEVRKIRDIQDDYYEASDQIVHFIKSAICFSKEECEPRCQSLRGLKL